MNIRFNSKGLFTLIIKRGLGPFRRRRRWLAKTQWMGREQLRQIQLKLLQKMITHCYEMVPYYRDTMTKRGIKPRDIRSLADIELFEVMNKETIRKASNRLISNKYPKLMMRTAYTGGTTGPRLPLKRDIISIGNEHAFVRRQFDWAGIKRSDRCAYLTWRTVVGPNVSRGRYYIYDAYMKELILSSFHLSLETAESYVEAVKKYEVKALAAYPSAAQVLARYILDRGFRVPLRAVLTTSETLGADEKEAIARAFCCRVYDYYGGAERVCYIQTCEKGSYHIIPEYGLTELADCAEPNEDCYRIIATGFWNRAMPLVRYDTGDLVRLGDSLCECRRNFPVVEKIAGRESKSIVTVSGRTLGLTAMGRLFKNALLRTGKLPIAESQIVLADGGGVRFEYIAGESYSPADSKSLERIMSEELPADLGIRIERVSKITKTINGKSLYLVKD